MIILVKNKHTLQVDEFKFMLYWKKGLTSKKRRDKKTPKGIFKLGQLFYRKDRIKKPVTKLNNSIIQKNFGWCDDANDKENYNRLVKIKNVRKSEKLFRKDYKYDLLITIRYNTTKRILGNGSAIFIHLTKDYKATAGCIALNKKDFLILLKLINKNTKIKID